MKERPILFNAQMVRAILEGRKTQTRRLVSGDPLLLLLSGHSTDLVSEQCPQGQPGDRLYVRETWGYEYGGGYLYRESHAHMMPGDGRWRPSIHMPRAASRITLEITGVRVELLNDISESDAIAEGIEVLGEKIGLSATYKDYLGDSFSWKCWLSARLSFKSLWESVYGAESWYSNPWVWVIEFKKI